MLVLDSLFTCKISADLSRKQLLTYFTDFPGQDTKVVDGMSRVKIALFGIFGVGNLGNEGSLNAMLQNIRRLLPEAEFLCICNMPAKVNADFSIPAVPIYTTPSLLFGFSFKNRLLRLLWKVLTMVPRRGLGWYRKFKHLRNVDLMIIPGTGAFDDFGVSPFDIPYQTLVWCLVAKIRGAKVKFVSVGAGPIQHPLSRWLMKSALRLGDYRSYRDQISKDFVESVGLNTKSDLVCPDLVFSLPRPRPVPDAPSDKRQLSVGVGVMAYYGWENRDSTGREIYDTYIEKLSQFVLWLLDQQHRVRLLVGEGTDQRAVDDVRKAIRNRIGASAEGQLIAPPIHSLNDLMSEIALTDLVVATRFHNIVCSLMVNKAVLSCGYAKKNDVLLAEMGLGRFCQHVETLDVSLLKIQFTELARDRKRFELRIQDKNREYEKSLATQYTAVLAECLLEN
jgi:polysaccharide pyruvyl transferase WcaK-like protein